MKVVEMDIPGVKLITPDLYKDDRGFFLETYNIKRYHEVGIPVDFVQDNHSRSAKGVLRGLHFQLKNPQGKLIRVVEGEVFDVAVDIRPGSPTFKKWVGCYLNDKEFQQFYIPPGFAHGFCVLSQAAQMEYKCTALYEKSDDYSVRWDDSDIGIEWPIQNPVLSEKDKNAPNLSEIIEKISPLNLCLT